MSIAADAAVEPPWPERRFSQAIAEGDGISLVPTLRGDLRVLAAAAEETGAEALMLEGIADVAAVRETTGLAVIVQLEASGREELERARRDGADAVAIPATALAADGALAYRYAVELGLDCAILVGDTDELEVVLDTLEPDILVAAAQPHEDAGLAILTDVPAGKLMIVEADLRSRDDVVELERAGVDALVIPPLERAEELAVLLRELIGAEHPLD